MSLPKDAAYYEKQEQEKCLITDGCLNTPSVRLICETEGLPRLSCYPCYLAWRQNLRDNPHNAPFCPRCVNRTRNSNSLITQKSTTAPLTGPVASILNNAMFAEGVQLDVRNRILQRLAYENAWIEDVDPEAIKAAREIHAALGDPVD